MKFPIVRQYNVADCGAACLTAIARFHKRESSVTRVRQLASTDRNGTTMLGLVQAAEKIGFAARAVRAPLDALASLPMPAIAHTCETGGRAHHYVVVIDVRGPTVQIMDPAAGQITRLEGPAFAARWSGALLLLVPTGIVRAEAASIPPFRRIVGLLKGHKIILTEMLMGAIVATVLGLTGSLYVQAVVDDVLMNGNRPLLNLVSVAAIVAALLFSVLTALRGMFAVQVGQAVDATLLQGYLTHLFRLPQRYFDTVRIGDVTSRLSDAVKIRVFLTDAIVDITLNILVLAAVVTCLLGYSPVLAAMVVGFIPVYLAIWLLSQRVLAPQARSLMERASRVQSHVVESLSTIGTIKRLGLERQFEERSESVLLPLLRASRRAGVWSVAISSATGLTGRLAAIAVLWFGATLALDRQLSIGALMSAYALVAYVTSPLAALIGSTRVLQEALIAGERLFEILDTEGESDGGRTFRGAIDGDVHLENVTMRYGSQAPALSNVSMTIKRGSVTAIVGRSGSGKSTVAAILQQLYPIEAGRIRVGELDLADVALQAVRSHMTVVPQHVDLFAGTILENIVPGESVPDLHKVMKACSDAGLTDFLRSLPTGLRTQVGGGGVTLSGGQRQRIAIARALYQDASLLILDEPSSALDASADGILHGIARTARAGGQAMLLITHRAELVELADYVFVLDRGVLVEEGPPGVLMSRKGALWALMTSPIREMPYFSSEAEADPKSRRVRIAGS